MKLSKPRERLGRKTALPLAALLAFSLTLPAGTGAYAAPSSERIAGETAWETSAAISKTAYPSGSEFAIIARSDDFADAMSATGLAGTLDCPIVTTPPNEPAACMLDEVGRLGAKSVYIIGGPAAIAPDVENALSAKGAQVQRIFGENAWDTSVECAKAIRSHGGNPTGDAIVTTSQNFQDALSISSFAFRHKVPIVLETAQLGLTDAARDVLAAATGKVYVPGGVMAVPRSSAEDFVGAERVVRLAGETGYDTSNQIATYLTDHGLLGRGSVFVATGAFASKGVDALSGAILAGKNNAPVVLVNGNAAMEAVDTTTVSGVDSEGTPSFLAANAGRIGKTIVLGGTYVVPDSFKATVEAAVRPGSSGSGSGSSGSNSGGQTSSAPAAPVKTTEDGFVYAIGDYTMDGTVRTGSVPGPFTLKQGSWFNVASSAGFDCGHGAYITGYAGESGNATVPSAIEGVPVVCFNPISPTATSTDFDLSQCADLKALVAGAGVDESCSFDLGSISAVDYVSPRSATLSALSQNNLKELQTLNLRSISGQSLNNAPKLAWLKLDDPDATSFSISGCPALKDLLVSGCPNLAALTAKNCPALNNIVQIPQDGTTSKLASADFSGCTALAQLPGVATEALTSLNLSGCTSLKELPLPQGKLTSLNLSGCTGLVSAYLHDNALTTINLSGCIALENLEVSNNKLTSLDVSGLTSLARLDCSGNPLTKASYDALKAWADEEGHTGVLGDEPEA